jgi:hypothetical protein
MPPYASYSSVLDGSLRLESSSTNSERYGNGSLIVQNGCEFYGSSDQYLKSSHASADLYIQSAKNLLASASSVSITGTTSAALVSTAGNVTARGTSANLTATTGDVSVVGVTSANLSSTAGSVLVSGATAVTVTSATGPVSLNATSGDATVQASGTVYLTGAGKQETFSAATGLSTGDYFIKSISGVATLLAEGSEARVFGNTLAHLRGTSAVKVESTSGNATVQASGTVYLIGTSKEETFTSVNATSSANYVVHSTAGDAKFESDTKDVKLYGKTLAHVRGTDSVKIESTAGDIKLISYTSVDSTAPTISSTATTSVSLGAPTINVVAATLSKVEAPTVEVGKTSDVVTISQLGKATNVKGNLTVDGTTTSTGDVSMLGNCSINGNLTVTGSTTNVSTQNLLVQDNIIVLNSASAAGKDAGLLFTRASGLDSTSLFWDESELSFVLASTKSTQDAPTVLKEAYSALRCSTITADSVTLVNFGTKTFTLDGQSSTPVTVDGINKTRGTYDFQIQSDAVNGSVYNYKMVKSSAAATSASFGLHAAGDDGSQVWVQWNANEVPKFYMKNYSANTGNLNFTVVFTTV